MFVVVLSTVFLNFQPLTAVMIVIMSLLDDVPIITIAYDRTPVSAEPIRWRVPYLLGMASVLGLFCVIEPFGLLLIGTHITSPPQMWNYFDPLTTRDLQTMVFLQLVVGGHLLLLVTRTEKWFFMPLFPVAPLLLAITATQIVAVLMCAFGWLVPAISWSTIGWVWVYNLCWMVAHGGIRQAAERFARYKTDRHMKSRRLLELPLSRY